MSERINILSVTNLEASHKIVVIRYTNEGDSFICIRKAWKDKNWQTGTQDVDFVTNDGGGKRPPEYWIYPVKEEA